MKALIRGERKGSLGVVLGLFGVLCLLLVSFGLAIYGLTNLHHLRLTLDARCQLRQASDLRQKQSLQSDADFYGNILTLTDQVPPAPTVQGRRLSAEYRAAVVKARADKQTAASGIHIVGCQAYR